MLGNVGGGQLLTTINPELLRYLLPLLSSESIYINHWQWQATTQQHWLCCGIFWNASESGNAGIRMYANEIGRGIASSLLMKLPLILLHRSLVTMEKKHLANKILQARTWLKDAFVSQSQLSFCWHFLFHHYSRYRYQSKAGSPIAYIRKNPISAINLAGDSDDDAEEV